MNLEELQIKIGIELKELNKQLKKASDDINEYIGPKATKKMMTDNNKVIKDGFKIMEKTTKTSTKQINKDLNDAFDIDKTLVKFNKNIDRSMEQAKRSVRSACNDIRRELNAALNVNANIRVSASASTTQRQNFGSRSNTAAMVSSNQYTAAMIVKAINGMISAENKNTGRLEGAINKSTNKLVSAISKQQNKNSKVENKVEVKAPEVKVNVPEIKVPEVTVNVPETEAKTPEVKIEIPEIKIPDIEIDLSQLDESINKLGDRLTSAISSLEDVIKSNNRQDKPVQVDTVKKPVVTKQQGGQQATSVFGTPVPSQPKQQPKVFRTSPSADDDYTRKVARKAIDDTYFDDIDKAFQSIIETISVLSTPLNPKKVIPSIVSQIALESIAENIKVSPGQQNSLIYGDIAKLEAQKEQLKNKRDGIIGGNGVDTSKINLTLYRDLFDKEIEQIDKAIEQLKKSLNPIDLKIPNPDELGAKELEEITARTKESVAKFNQAIEQQTLKIQQQIKQSQIDFNAKNKPIVKKPKKIDTTNIEVPEDVIATNTGDSGKSNGVLKRYQEQAKKVKKQLSEIITGLNMMDDGPDTDELDKYEASLENIKRLLSKLHVPKNNKEEWQKARNELKHYAETVESLQKKIKDFRSGSNEIDFTPEFRRINDSNKPNIGESDNNSLGFLPYKQQLNDLAETAKKVGAKIKNIFGKIGSEVKGIFKGTGTNLFGDFGKSFDSHVAVHRIGEMREKIKEQLNKMKNDYKKTMEGISKVANKLTAPFKSMWSRLAGIFKKGAKDCEKATSGLNLKLKDLLKTALSFVSVYGLINLGKEAITQSATLAQAESKLTALMRQRMGATNETVKVIRELAKEQANLGVVSETAMVRGAEQLSMYVHSAKALETLIPAIANMTARRGGLFATPEDAEEIATQLGEAIREGTTTPLEQSGIYLSEAEIQKFSQLTTEEARAAYLADVIAKNVGNLNQQLANTPHGAIAQLKNNFKSLLGTLGTLLVNVIQPIVKWLNVIVVAANNALKALGELLGFDMSGGGLAGVDLGTGGGAPSTAIPGAGESDTSGIDNAKDSLDGAKDSAEEAEKAVEKFKGSLMGFDEINILSNNLNDNKDSGSEEFDPTDITPGAGGQLTPGEYIPTEMTEGDSIFDKFGEKMKAFMDEIIEPFKNAWALLGDRWKEEWADLIESFKNFCTSLATFLKSVWDNGGKEFVQHMAEIGLACGIAAMEIGGEILDSLARLWQHLDPSTNMNTQGFLDALNEVSVKIREFILGLGDHFESLMANGGQDVLNALGDCFMNLGEAATRGLGVAVDALDGLIDHLDPANNSITQGMLQAWEGAFLAIGDAALGFVGLLESTLKNGGQEVINALGDAFNSLLGLVGTVVEEIADALNGLFEHLDPKTNEFTQGMLKAWQGAFEGISGMAQDIGEVLASAMDNGGQDLVNAIGDLAMKVGDAFGTVVEVAANCIGDLFKHLDPAENDIAKGAIESFEYFVNSIGDFVKSLAESLKTFMDNGGQEFVNNVADIILIIGDLAFTIGGDILSAISTFMDSWLGHAVISTCATALELVSEVLKGLLEILEPLSPLISGVVAAFAGFQVASKVVGFITSIVTAFQALGGAGGILALVKGGFTALWAVIAANPIAAVVAAIAGIGVALVALYNKCEGFRDFIDGILKGFSGLFEKIKEHFSTLLEDVRNIFGDVIDIITGIFEGDGQKVGEAVRNLILDILKLIRDMNKAFVEVGWELIKGLVQGIWECIKTLPRLLSGFLEFVVDFFKGLFGIHSPSTVFAELGKNLIEGLIEGILSLVDSVKNAFTKVGKAISDAAKDISKTVSNYFKETKEVIKERLEETKEVVSEKLQRMKETATEKVKGTYEAIKDKWQNAKEAVSDRAKDIYTTVKDKFQDIYETVKGKADDTYNKVSDSWTKIKDDAGKKLEQIRTDAEKKYNDVKTTLVTKIGEAKDGIVGKWEEVRTKTNECIENVKTTAENSYENVKQTIARKLDEVSSNTSKKWEEVKRNTGDAVERVRQEAENKYNAVKNSMVSTLENARKEMLTKWDAIKSEAITRATEAAENASAKFADIKTKFGSKMDEVKSTLETKWENIKSQTSTKASDIAKKAESAFSNIGSKASSALESARTSISKGLSKISSLFSNTKWSLPKIKLPHFKITGGFSLNPPSVPKFGVEWYKRGGIIDGITPLGFTGGTMHMGGEAGKEMVVPLENTSFTSKIAQAMGQAVDNALARNYNNQYNNNNNSNNESRDVVLKIDDREFARASINSINKLQRESGRTLLDI